MSIALPLSNIGSVCVLDTATSNGSVLLGSCQIVFLIAKDSILKTAYLLVFKSRTNTALL